MPAVLTAAAEIVTVEARHQTFIRTASKAVPVPNAFDTPLGPRAVFTLAAQFIQSCPQGSNLNIQAFPAISLAGGGTNIAAGQSLVLADPNQPAGAQFCAFLNQGQTMFAQLQAGSCQVPQNMSGEVYMMVTRSASIADSEILAGYVDQFMAHETVANNSQSFRHSDDIDGGNIFVVFVAIFSRLHNHLSMNLKSRPKISTFSTRIDPRL